MKIGVLIDQLVPGGVQKAAIEEVRYLREFAHDARLLVIFRKRYDYQYEDLVQEIPVEFLSDRFPKLFQKSIKFPIFSFFSSFHITSPFVAPRYFTRKEYDIIISHGITTCLTAQRIWKEKQIPYLSFIWDPTNYTLQKVYNKTILRFFFPILMPIFSRVEGSFLRSSAKVLTGSRVHSAFLKEEYNLHSEVIYPGCYPQNSFYPGKDNFILACTRWDRTKNPMLLLDLVARIPQVKLVIAGLWTDINMRTEFERRIHENGLSDRVQIYRYLDQSLLIELSKKARMFIHPNFEAFGLGCLEAAACGCPIIITRGSGVTELFRHGVHGFFPEKTTVEDYEQYVKILAENDSMAWSMGQEAWTVAKKYTWEYHARMLINTIEECLSNHYIEKTFNHC